jgi:hypothetical protein
LKLQGYRVIGGYMIELLKHQEEFIETKEHEVLMLSPVATGKTFIQLYEANAYALKYPESTQVYMCRHPQIIHEYYSSKLLKNGEFHRMTGECRYSNGSKVILAASIKEYILSMMSHDIEVYRIDVDIFDIDKKTYEDSILRRTYRPSKYPQAVKITATDCLYSFTKRPGLRIIEGGK